tara:strand:+ start:13313 stop:15424 length:2112 start_codon:yes stop_codon:yes gene_type:complete
VRVYSKLLINLFGEDDAMKITDAVLLEIRDEVALITIENPPVNALSHNVRFGVKKAIELVMADESVSSIVIYCSGRTFCAGADIKEFGAPMQEPVHSQLHDLMDSVNKPIIAGIHGTALGGGLELALSCHYRVAISTAKLGLPEVQLGILPGAGGTQRLPRLVGPKKALDMVISGMPIGAKEALDYGLIDKLVDSDLLAAVMLFAREKGVSKNDHIRVRDRDEKLKLLEQSIFSDARKAISRRARGFIAPEYNIRCIEAAVNKPFDEGISIESDLVMELMKGDQARAQQYFFFAERQASKIEGLSKGIKHRSIFKVGVIGGGLMGGGISMNMANVNIPVTLIETSEKALEQGLKTIRNNYESAASKGRISFDAAKKRYELIKGSLDLGDLNDCDLIIEAVFEEMSVKKDIFSRLDSIVKQDAILASNTSALNLNEIASATTRPQSVIGLHFFSPANVMKLLEVVRGKKTADDVIATCMSFAKRINKVPVLVGVCPGFVGNRILHYRQIQANHLALEGVPIEQIDRVLYEFGFPMGPFQMGDLAGLDLGWKADSSNSSDIRDRLCELGRFGQKSGNGFYDYEGRKPIHSDIVSEVIRDCGRLQGIEHRDSSDNEILDRCLLPMINEGAKILEEGIASRASDIDVVYVYGYGWPRYRGGPMHYANCLGLKKVIEKLQHYREITGDDFWMPCQFLVDLADSQSLFT